MTPVCRAMIRAKRTGLVVAAAPAAPPVQRHRNQHIGLGEQFAAGARHPAAHRGREIGAVLVFQGMHQRARDVVIAHRGAGARIGRRIGDRLHRQQFGAGIVDKGNAEPRAIGRRDERQFRPARRADAFAVDRFAAGDAQRRQRDVERQPRGLPPGAAAGARARRADGRRSNGTVMPRRPWREASAALRDAQACCTGRTGTSVGFTLARHAGASPAGRRAGCGPGNRAAPRPACCRRSRNPRRPGC